jgi:fibronectin type III domain protein
MVTTVNVLTQAQLAGRIAALVPHGWAGDDAAQSGLYGDVLQSLGQQLEFVMTELLYAANAQRLTSETFPELDEASTDFLGSNVPRPAGMTDAAYAALIIQDLFQTAVTRAAISNGIQGLTGAVPRMLEPWNIFDTGVFDHISYMDVDTPANPARLGDASLAWQGFIETVPPSIPAIGPNNPILCMDDNAYWDVPGYFCGTIQPTSLQAVYNLINRLRAWGITVWVKFLTNLPQGTVTIVAPSAPASLTIGTVTPQTVALSWPIPTVGTPPFTYQVTYQVAGVAGNQTGPSSQTNSVVVSGLTPGTTYTFEVAASNSAGPSGTSPTAPTTTGKIIPGPATALQAINTGQTLTTIVWGPPATGTPPFTYQVLYRVTGTTTFTAWGTAGSVLSVTVTGLLQSTEYDFEVRTSNL